MATSYYPRGYFPASYWAPGYHDGPAGPVVPPPVFPEGGIRYRFGYRLGWTGIPGFPVPPPPDPVTASSYHPSAYDAPSYNPKRYFP